MENRIPPGSYFQYPPTGVHNTLQRSSSLSDRERYLAELLAERQKLGPFVQIMPVCSRLLNQEIMRVSGLVANQFIDHERTGHEYPYSPLVQQPNVGQMNMEGWNSMQTEENRFFRKMVPFPTSPINWQAAPGTTPIVKRVLRLDVPVDKFPNFNFVGRLLGPRGNSLKRVEAMTECKIYIRGRGSVKDSLKVGGAKENYMLLGNDSFSLSIFQRRFKEDVNML